MAQLYTTGPAHIYLAFPTGSGTQNSPVYFGTCEDAPQVQIIPKFEDVYNSIGGTVPFDKSYQGEVALIDLDMNRYNESVYGILAARPRVGTRGVNIAGDVGTLMGTEGYTIGVYLKFDFGAAGAAPKAAYTANGMPPGYRFPGGIPIGPDRLQNLGTRPRKTNVVFFAIRIWNPATQAFGLYDFNLNGLPAIN